MNKEQKAAVVEEVATQITESEAVFAVDYRGISVPQAAELREKLNEAGARFRVVKNTLTIRAADEADAEDLKELLEGPTAFTFVAPERGDVALAADLTIGAKDASWSESSWRYPRARPMRSLGIWLETATTGMCALAASMREASETSAPGPVDRSSAAGQRVARA